MRTTEVVLVEPGTVRPEVPIPLAPLGGPARLLRRLAVGPGRSSFQRARNVTLGWLVAAVLAVIVDRLVVAHVLAMWAAVALVVYAVARVVALVVVERRQCAFEWRWLDDQSRLLRRHPFEVVAVRVRVTSAGTGPAVRTLDLTDAADVGWLLDRQTDPGVDVSSQARIEFGYWAVNGSGRSSDSVRRGLWDLQVHPVDAPVTRARIRFPQARYVTVADSGGAGGQWPGRAAHWSLVGPVRLTTARAA
ncbi:hypothetical protein [Micromonospora sp. U21]|uniref:hypothetical protein n=1 Tax=Micromonospora sp. U21 TaxID=2824899 RepID=UPI001B38B8E1|nr:hypothetical protein [Micromonospora sp. U21]MBQ0904506.1 hypothetical protein [Micromonospora sp. U21]